MSLAPRTFEVLPFTAGEGIRIRGKTLYACGGSLDNCLYSICTEEPAERIRWTERGAKD